MLAPSRRREDDAETTRHAAPAARKTPRTGKKKAPARAAKKRPPVVASDPVADARQASLRYVGDDGPGIRRRRAGSAFSYTMPDGTKVKDRPTLARIRALVIPPAWTDVWICPLANGHIQATGRDARGRKQYRYHARWREVRDQSKYTKMIAFGEALPKIRAAVEADLKKTGLSREKVFATVVRLLERTLIRIGNEEYARTNQSYGLTTLHNDHVQIEGSRLHFRFRGKSGKEHAIELADRRLARIVAQCSELPGQALFQYVGEDGNLHPVESADINAYLKEVSGEEFTAKDFRTWAGTVLASDALRAVSACQSKTEAARNIVQAVKTVAARLGNTPAVCKRSYIHPAVLDAYLEGFIEGAQAALSAVADAAATVVPDVPCPTDSLTPAETAVLDLLRKRLAA